MGLLNTIATSLAVASLVSAQNDPGAHIDKPLLFSDGLDSLKQGIMDNLPETPFTYELQAPGTIPTGCNNVFHPSLIVVLNLTKS